MTDIDNEMLVEVAHIARKIGFDNLLSLGYSKTFMDYQLAQRVRPLKLEIVKRFQCDRCGICCTGIGVQVNEEEIINLCKHLRVSINEFHEKYVQPEYTLDSLHYRTYAFECR